MKKLILSALSFLTFTSVAVGAGEVFVSETFIRATFCNQEAPYIRCAGRVVGRTYYGQVLWSNVNLVLPYGQCGNAYVYTNPSNPFVAGDSNVWCQ